MKRHTTHILGAALLGLAVMLAGGAALAAAPADSSPQKLRVALLLDQTPDDAGPAEALQRGLKKAEAELGIAATMIVVPGADNAAFTAGARQDEILDAQEKAFKVAAAKHDLVLVGSPALHELLMNNAGNFRRTLFGCIDGAVKAPNIASITFTDTEAAFLAGAAAATLTTHTPIPGINAQRVLGWVGDFDTPPRRVEAEAFLQGARLVHPETRVIIVFTADQAEDAGYRAASGLYAQGADIVAHSAGKAGLGVLRAAAEHKAWAIGHTSDQADKSPAVLFSQLHNSEAAVYDLIKAAVEKRFAGGSEEVRGLARNEAETADTAVNAGGVGLTSLEPLRQHLGAAFPADLPQRLRELAFEIQRGSITLPKVQKKSLCDCL